ncbi:MAG: helix-turn-helix transcriptional regulator [Salinivirgaceae bacterium]|jgi:transcriptional regulator with XRE-family HTH domain|nr:helix-turn-helix transcriptional regulator [Salinivirgaceae bacterium]
MNMTYNENHNISEEFRDIFNSLSEEDHIEVDAQMLSFKFLEALDKYFAPKKLKKKEIAEAVGKSPSFISQVYSGDKLISMPLLAKLQTAFNFTFDIKASRNSIDYDLSDFSELKTNNKKQSGFWVWKNAAPNESVDIDYTNSDNLKLINNKYSSAG